MANDDDWQQLDEDDQGQNMDTMMPNVYDEGDEQDGNVEEGEEQDVNVDEVEEVDGEEEEVNVDGDDEEEENVPVVVAEEEDGEEENVGVGFGEPRLPKVVKICYGDEENIDVDVDIDDEDEPPQSSIPVLGTDDPFPSASNSGVVHTAVGSSTHSNNTAEDVLAAHVRLSTRPSCPTDHPHVPLIVSRPRGMPYPSTVPTTSSFPREETVTPLAAADDESTPTAEGGVSPTVQIASGADVFEVTTAAGVQFISSKMVDVPPTIQDIPEADTEQVHASPTTGTDLASANAFKDAPFDHLKEPPPNMDGKSSDFLLRKNSIPQDRTVNLDTQMENALRNLSSQASSEHALELNQTELPMKNETEAVVARSLGNRDLLESADTAGGTFVKEREDIEPSSSSSHDPRAFDGLNALTSAIDIGDAREQLAKLQPNLDNGADGRGGGVAAAGSNSASERLEREKTELELEMELFEASEREEEARLLASMRSDQSVQPHGDSVNDRKRASKSIPNEARKKRGKRVVTNDEPKEEEDVCFICFDGGELVLCDRRTCPKAYHLSCIGRDIAFFQKKGAWICGKYTRWHFCSLCTKPANFQCYTCPTAYCSECLDKADFHCVRHRKGLCEECWPIVQMIENKETVDLAGGVEVDFTDQETYEGLFKEYWEDLKQRLSITSEELDKGGKGVGGSAGFTGSDGEDRADAEDYMTESGDEMDEEEEQEEDEEDREGARKRKGKRSKVKAQLAEGTEGGDTDLGSDNDDDDDDDEMQSEEDDDEKPSVQPREFDGWGSKELIEFVKYMNEDPKKPLSRFQVTKLLWSYIKSEKLQDPRKKTQIQCDDRLRTIFGKKTVGQFEMFKHLQSHFAPKGGRRAGRQMREEQAAGVEEGVDADGGAMDEKSNRVKDVKDRRRRRKTDEDKFERPNVDEFAAVTPKNIGLIYLRRQLLEELLDDPEFDSKVCNTFVRIRVPGMMSKSEMCYRLVQVVGTRSQAEQYKAGRKFTNYVLEILNLQKREDVTVDLVSNHDFDDEECQRLRQSIKCGFIRTLTVGDVEEKARALQEAKVNDWFETERQRLVNLRDRASEKGRKKELRECVEKLQELNSPAFRAAKLHARPEVTADPRMDPSYESDSNDDKGRDGTSKVLDKSLSPMDKILPMSSLKGSSHNESSRMDWEGSKMKHSTWSDTNRSKAGDRGYDSTRPNDKLSFGRPGRSYGVESMKERGYEERERGWGMEQQNDATDDGGWMGNGRNRATPTQKWNEKVDLSISVDTKPARSDYRGMPGMTTPVFDTKADWQTRRESAPPAAPSLPQGFTAPSAPNMTQAAIEAAEKEKNWHYMDPTGMVQGPFAMEQLRKWNTTGYFPEDLRIWKTSQAREESILLNDALAGRFQKEREPSWGSSAARVGANPVVASIQDEIAHALTTSSTLPFNENPAKSADSWRENGGASSWTDSRGGYGDVGRSGTLGGMDVNQNNRPFSRDSVTGPTAPPVGKTSIDMKWKSGPASGMYEFSYGRSVYHNSSSRGGRADAAAKFDPANWGSRSGSGRPERDGWGSSVAPGNEGEGYSSMGGRNSLGRGSSYRDSGGKWNPDDDSSRSSSRNATRAARKDIPCRFHQKGYCKRGDSCDFWHG